MHRCASSATVPLCVCVHACLLVCFACVRVVCVRACARARACAAVCVCVCVCVCARARTRMLSICVLVCLVQGNEHMHMQGYFVTLFSLTALQNIFPVHIMCRSVRFVLIDFTRRIMHAVVICVVHFWHSRVLLSSKKGEDYIISIIILFSFPLF